MNNLFASLLISMLGMTSCHGQGVKAGLKVEDAKPSEKSDFITSSTGKTIPKISLSDKDWKERLSSQEYYVIRKKGTERAFSGELLSNKKDGIYACRACQLPLFDSKTKYNSGTGWPSFWEPVEDEFILRDIDHDIGYPRTEVMCMRCGGHLGHVFPDGPKPTGLRYCINSVSLTFFDRSESEKLLSDF
ncbi:MAG TPA: peptide-methionine (R)-S-oxide reductase MsrB [Saprospiraceae bacterium]|nr:peptide-methionine (R)-S-oxide reductase MsrB [Saprospiraceae bacterium]